MIFVGPQEALMVLACAASKLKSLTLPEAELEICRIALGNPKQMGIPSEKGFQGGNLPYSEKNFINEARPRSQGPSTLLDPDCFPPKQFLPQNPSHDSVVLARLHSNPSHD